MAMICREILSMPSLKDLKVVAGAGGLDRTVRWVYVAECFDDTRQIVDWLYGGELVFITGRGIKGDPNILTELIEDIHKKNVSGLIVNVGPYIPEIPEKAIEMADKLGLPLLTVPWEARLVEITRDLSSAIILKEMEEKSLDNLLENILFSDSDVDENLVDRAAYYGYDLSGHCQVCIIDIDRFADFLRRHNLHDEKAIIEIKTNLKRIVQEVLVKNNKKALLMLRSDSVVFLNKRHGNDTRQITAIINEIRALVARKLNGLTISAGVGNSYASLGDMRKSLKEAEQALKVAKLSETRNSTCFFDELGIYSLLLSIKDRQVLEKYYQDSLGAILEYDKLNSSELLNTMEMLLRESGNITTTSEKLFIHRNTLKYRVQKIEEILTCDLRDLQDCIRLEMGFMIKRLLDDLNA